MKYPPAWGPVRTVAFGELKALVVLDIANRVTYYAPYGTRVAPGGPEWVPDRGDFLHVVTALKRIRREAPE